MSALISPPSLYKVFVIDGAPSVVTETKLSTGIYFQQLPLCCTVDVNSLCSDFQ